MYKAMFTIYLLLHIIGDFILQTDKQSREKQGGFVHVLLHSLLYSIPFLAIAFFLEHALVWLIQAVVLIAAHLVVDSVKFFMLKRKKVSGPLPFLVDQSVHLAILAVMALLTFEQWYVMRGAEWLGAMLRGLDVNAMHILAWICMLLAVSKPANITIRQLLVPYKPQEKELSEKRAGALIGTLERIIMLLLLGMAQYTAIALVLTAKSVARYDMLKDRAFAEYYLLGTLLSTLFVLIVFIILAP